MSEQFDSIDKAILNYMYRANRWVTSGEVARETGIALATARLHLKDLWRRGYTRPFKQHKREYWAMEGVDATARKWPEEK